MRGLFHRHDSRHTRHSQHIALGNRSFQNRLHDRFIDVNLAGCRRRPAGNLLFRYIYHDRISLFIKMR